MPLDDAAAVLSDLQKKYILGIITNGPSDGQRKKLQKSGLLEFFDESHIVVSGDLPFRKPDPRIFLHACEKMNIEPQEAVYVGDLYGRDVIGARRAGLTPIWIQTQGNRKHESDIIVIHTLTELLNYL